MTARRRKKERTERKEKSLLNCSKCLPLKISAEGGRTEEKNSERKRRKKKQAFYNFKEKEAVE